VQGDIFVLGWRVDATSAAQWRDAIAQRRYATAAAQWQ